MPSLVLHLSCIPLVSFHVATCDASKVTRNLLAPRQCMYANLSYAAASHVSWPACDHCTGWLCKGHDFSSMLLSRLQVEAAGMSSCGGQVTGSRL